MDILSSYASVSVDDIDKAKEFYVDKLGLEIVLDGSPNILMIAAADSRFMVYQKDDHQPATHTTINFAVEDVKDTLDDLKDRGVEFDKEDDGDKDGIVSRGPMKIVWFKDPAGNTLSLTEGL